MDSSKTDFSGVVEALRTYDAEHPALSKRWEHTSTNEEVYQLEADEKKCADKVRLAFYEATKTFNSKDNCLLVDVEWIRKLVKEQQPPEAG